MGKRSVYAVKWSGRYQLRFATDVAERVGFAIAPWAIAPARRVPCSCCGGAIEGGAGVPPPAPRRAGEAAAGAACCDDEGGLGR